MPPSNVFTLLLIVGFACLGISASFFYRADAKEITAVKTSASPQENKKQTKTKSTQVSKKTTSVAAKPAVEAKVEKKSWLHGWVSQTYRWRTTGKFSDHDTETMVTLDIGDPQTDRFSGSIQGGVIIDVDGKNNTIFSGIYDAYTSRAVGRLYSAYLDVKKVGPFKTIRAGRQHLYEIESLYFDGASFESRPFVGLTLLGFGGVPVHLYESQFGLNRGDWTAGFALQWNPVARFRMRANFTHLTDKAAGFRITERRHSDNLMGLSAWLDLTSQWDLFGRITSFTDQVRDLEIASSVRFPKQDFKMTVNIRRLMKSYAIRVIDWDAFGVAGALKPYTEVMVSFSKGLGKHFTIDAGGGGRFLDRNQAFSNFNHGFKKVYLSLSSSGFLIKNLSTTITGDYYHGENNNLRNNYFGVSSSTKLSLLKKKLIIGWGSAYYLYRYNLLNGNESKNVRTYFAELEGRPGKRLRLKGNYEFEKNSFNGFHSGRVSVMWDF